MRHFPPLIIALLLSSLVLTISRAATLPFITIYLVERFQLAPDSVGFILGISLTIGILTSLYSGYLVDRFNKNQLILTAISLFAFCFLMLPWISHPLGFIAVLALFHAAYTIFSIAIKASFAALLAVDERIKAFSANYTLINVGWAIGPALGVFAASMNTFAPFVFSGTLALAVLIVLSVWLKKQPVTLGDTETLENPPLSFKQTLVILRDDKRLIFFTLGSIMGAIVFGQFSGYISQYLITIADAAYVYKVIGAVMTTNAMVVITLQYFLSSRLTPQNLMRWLTFGTLFFILGLIGFMNAISIPIWVIAMAVFTLGEIIAIPAEYLFIDFIAPAHLKGSYYGVQSLGYLGGAINPILCGTLLSYTPPHTMFYALIACAIISLYFFYHGFYLTKNNTR